jgi:hypothetical protein
MFFNMISYMAILFGVVIGSAHANTVNPRPVFLGKSHTFAILTKSGVSTVPDSMITGDVGASPIALTSVTGFSYEVDASGTFATSNQVVGKIYAASSISPTPSFLSQAVLDMEKAYVNATTRVGPDFVEYHAGLLSSTVLSRGLYKFSSNVNIYTDCTLAGNETDIWVFQIAGNLVLAADTRIILAEGAQAKNIYWVVAGFVEIGTGAHFEGIILGASMANFRTRATMNGKVLVQTAVTLQSTTINMP